MEHVAMSEAVAQVEAYHYAHGCGNTAVFRHGLYRRGEWPFRLSGIALWLPPTRQASKASWDGDPDEVIALTRLVVVPDVPTNAASFLLARSSRMVFADGRYRCLVTYADTWRGHTGAIYRAAGWEYLGLTDPTPVWTKGGRLIGMKTTLRNRSVRELREMGATFEGRFPKHKFRLIHPEDRAA